MSKHLLSYVSGGQIPSAPSKISLHIALTYTQTTIFGQLNSFDLWGINHYLVNLLRWKKRDDYLKKHLKLKVEFSYQQDLGFICI